MSVVVLPLPPENECKPLPEFEIEITTQCGHGKGGQNQNKVASACRAIHRPTGIQVFINGRDQGQNKKTAIRILTARVNEAKSKFAQSAYDELRRNNLGDGSRGRKIRTYNFINFRVTDHVSGVKTSKIEDVMRGRFDLLR